MKKDISPGGLMDEPPPSTVGLPQQARLSYMSLCATIVGLLSYLKFDLKMVKY